MGRTLDPHTLWGSSSLGLRIRESPSLVHSSVCCSRLEPEPEHTSSMSLKSPFRVRGAELLTAPSSLEQVPHPQAGADGPSFGDKTGCEQKPFSILIVKTCQQKRSAQTSFIWAS